MSNNKTECKYCYETRVTKGYREVDGMVSSEIVCEKCMRLSKYTLMLIANPNTFVEGDDYWSALTRDNETLIGNSCWDDQSVELWKEGKGKLLFKTLEDIVAYYARTIQEHTELEVHDFRLNGTYKIQL